MVPLRRQRGRILRLFALSRSRVQNICQSGFPVNLFTVLQSVKKLRSGLLHGGRFNGKIGIANAHEWCTRVSLFYIYLLE